MNIKEAGQIEPGIQWFDTLQSVVYPQQEPVVLRAPVDAGSFTRDDDDRWTNHVPVVTAKLEYYHGKEDRWYPLSSYVINPTPTPQYNTDNQQSSKTIMEKDFNPSLMKAMGYDYAGKSDARLGSDTFVYNNDKDKSRSKKITRAVNKNLDKTRKDTLHNPGTVGISLPKRMRG